MKFFIASPWRNKEKVQELSDLLVARGHVAYSFINCGANLASDTSINEEFKEFGTALMGWEDNPLVEKIFRSELEALKASDGFILLEPSGRSSLAEAGIAYGMGKPITVIGLVEHPEIVYRIVSSHYATAQAFLESLK